MADETTFSAPPGDSATPPVVEGVEPSLDTPSASPDAKALAKAARKAAKAAGNDESLVEKIEGLADTVAEHLKSAVTGEAHAALTNLHNAIHAFKVKLGAAFEHVGDELKAELAALHAKL